MQQVSIVSNTVITTVRLHCNIESQFFGKYFTCDVSSYSTMRGNNSVKFNHMQSYCKK